MSGGGLPPKSLLSIGQLEKKPPTLAEKMAEKAAEIWERREKREALILSGGNDDVIFVDEKNVPNCLSQSLSPPLYYSCGPPKIVPKPCGPPKIVPK